MGELIALAERREAIGADIPSATARTEEKLFILAHLVAGAFLGEGGSKAVEKLQLGGFDPSLTEARMVAVGMAAALVGFNNAATLRFFHLRAHEFDALAVKCHRWESASHRNRLVWRFLKSAVVAAISDDHGQRPCDVAAE